ncbi:HET-domain-containing protein, partial [Polyplosphaeria fusca]
METGRSVLRRWDFVKPNPNYDFLRDRLRECREKHRKCRHNHTNRHHNIHVVNVRERIIQPLPIDAEYFALSYVWGSAMQNYSSSCRSVSRSLPRTIEDAMVVVKSLGLDYLWVDSLCINQSDSEEKLQQIRHMDSVYEAAFATIIVLDSSNADSGIFGVGQERVQAQMWADIGGHRVVARLPSLRDELDASHWAKRAWTLQEGQLSTRCLVFSKHQVHFFCNEHNHSE